MHLFLRFCYSSRRFFGRDSRGTNLLDALWQLYISNAGNTAERKSTRCARRPRRSRTSERETQRGQPWQAASCRPICLDTQRLACTQDRLPWLGLKAVKTPSTSCESCQALSALFPIAGARAANTAETISKEWSVYVRKQKILLHEAQGKFLHQ